MRVLEMQWSWALSLVYEVALNFIGDWCLDHIYYPRAPTHDCMCGHGSLICHHFVPESFIVRREEELVIL